MRPSQMLMPEVSMSSMQQQHGRMLHQSTAAGPVEAIGFSGSGFLLMYMVGVAAVLKNLGLVDSSTKIAGSSGGGVAGAMLCSDVATDKFMSTATALSLACGGSNCRGNLQSVVKAGMSAMLPADAHSRCSGRLFVSVTEATGNPAADVERKISSFASNSALIEALATTTYIPGYAGPSTVTYPTGLGVAAAYDGVSSNPLPVPPGASHVVTVSALAGSGAPDFSSLVAAANARSDQTGPYHPLNPQLQPQPSHVDIYPGLSGGLSMSADAWNSYVLQAPDNDMLQYLYDQGRRDAAAYVRTAFPGSTAEASAVLESTARDVNAIPIPTLIEAAVTTANAAAVDPVGTISAVQTAGLSTLTRVFG